MNFAGTPATTQLSGIERLTTLPAPTITRFPIFTPGKMMEFVPMKTSLPISIGA